MSRVVVGAYRPGISLRELHKAMPETWHGYNGESPQGDVEEIFTKIDVQAVESAVYVIPWEESVIPIRFLRVSALSLGLAVLR